MDSCISSNISRYYEAWLDKATRLAHDKNKGSDLLHEVLARLMDRPEQDIKDIVCRGKVEAYINRAIWLSWHSNRSDYAIKYRKYYDLHVDKHVEDTKQDETWIGAFVDGEYLYSAIGRMHEFDAILLRLYSKPDFDYKELSVTTGIPYPYLRTSIHRALKKIREYVKLQRAIAHSERETIDMQKM